MKINNTKLLELLGIIALSLTPLIWFKNNSLVLGHDSGFRIKFLKYLYDLFYSWNPNVGFGADLSINKGFLITQFPETFFSYLSGSLRTGEMLTFIFWFFVIGITMYVFVNSFFPKKEFWFVRIFSSLFYMFNFFILQAWFIAERAKFSLFAALPLGFLVLYKTFTREYSLIKGAILFSLIFFILNGGSSPPLYGAVLLSFSVLVLYFTFLQLFGRNYREIIYYVKIVISFALASLLVNAYWVLPQIYLIFSSYSKNLSAQGGIEGILGWESVVSKYASTINLLRFQGIPDWYENAHHAYSYFFQSNSWLIFASFIPIAIILTGLFFYKSFSAKFRNDKLFFLLCFVFLIGLIFTSGSHPPFGALYVQLIKYVPGFVVFRSAFYKFGPALWFSATFLCGYLLNLLLIHFVKSRRYFYLIAGVSVLLLLLYNFPYFKGDFFKWSPPFSTNVSVPEYVHEMSDYVNENTDVNSRVLLMPPLDPDSPSADSYTWGFWSLDTLPQLSIDRSTITNTDYAPQIVSDLYRSLEMGDVSAFRYGLGVASVDKILWRDDVLYANKISTSENLNDRYSSFSSSYGNPQKKIGKWELYDAKTSDYLPQIFAASDISYSQSQMPVLAALQSQDMPQKPLFVNISGENDYVSKLVKNNAGRELAIATCVGCDNNESWDLQRNRELPRAQVLPGSRFYFLIEDKEKKLLSETNGSAQRRIDVELSQSTDRLRELFALVGLNASGENDQVIENTVKKYESSMSDAYNLFNNLPDVQINEYKLRYAYFLQLHYNFLQTLDKNNISDQTFQQLLNFQQNLSSQINEGIWVTKTGNDKKYVSEIKDDGIYTLWIESLARTPSRVLIDGLEIDPEGLELKKGFHKIELIYDQDTNLTNPQNLVNNLLLLESNKPNKFEINNFDKNKNYVVEFDYVLKTGEFPNFSIDEYDEAGNQIKLEHELNFQLDPLNDRFYYIYQPHPSAEKVNFSLENIQNSQQSEIVINNFSVSKDFTPRVVLKKDIERQDAFLPPQIEFERKDPSKYEVSVRDAKKPFFLVLNQSYNPGWKISLEEGSPSHFMVNDFSNAWYIDKTGSYVLTIEYLPQKYVYYGTFISIVSIVGLLVLWISRKNEKKDKN